MDYELIYSGRRTLAIEVTPEGKVLVRAPYDVPRDRAEEFLLSRRGWVEKHLQMLPPPPDKAEEAALKKRAAEILPGKLAYWAGVMDVHPTGMKITGAKKRLGSCSGRNSICFSWMLMHYPEELVDYVVVHELAHIKHHDHSPAFHALVRRYLPDEKERRKRLKRQ